MIDLCEPLIIGSFESSLLVFNKTESLGRSLVDLHMPFLHQLVSIRDPFAPAESFDLEHVSALDVFCRCLPDEPLNGCLCLCPTTVSRTCLDGLAVAMQFHCH